MTDDLPETLAEFEARAADVLDPGPLGYYAGGAGDEVTLRDNLAAWQRIRLRPRVLVDVSKVDTSVEVLGRERPHPLLVAPMAYHRLAHPEGEEATARGAHAAQAINCLSTLATARPRDVAEAAPDSARWFQVYVMKDRGVTREMVAEVAAHGFEALVLTADLPVLGRREREIRTGFEVGEATSVPALHASGASGTLDLTHTAAWIDPAVTWRDLEWLAGESGLPVLVKGVLDPQDARRAVQSGARGVIVSNHGGRQLDTVAAGADALPSVVGEVGGEVDVLVDGGIRRGTDVVKALALGAGAVLVGRPVLWGLATAGSDGVARTLQIIRDELETALALIGRPRARRLDRTCLLDLR